MPPVATPPLHLARTAPEHCPVLERDRAEQSQLRRLLPELLELERLMHRGAERMVCRSEAAVAVDDLQLPIYSVALGNPNRECPAILLTGGVHGVERIGTQVILGFLHSLVERLTWDASLTRLLDELYVVMVPIVNPGGMYHNWRANPNGVDLNRNAPVDVDCDVGRSTPLIGGGQRFSRYLPWYRGKAGKEMEVEAQALEKVVLRELTPRPASLVLDLHSGFGFRDRLWFPYAYRRRPISTLAEYMSLKLLWERSYPSQAYQFEPQSQHYLTHGDLWDFLCIEMQYDYKQLFLPLTLELGSWNWVRKRPQQMFSRLGLFHPMVPHRQQRALRDHQLLLHFMLKATSSYSAWLPDSKSRDSLHQAALNLWYQDLL
nr:DUF2817 domain-containing protein [Marinibactrum halimedae]